jgi:transposase-like protein
MSREGQASLAQLSKELGINAKTVAKWRKRQTVEDLKTGPGIAMPKPRAVTSPSNWQPNRIPSVWSIVFSH